VARRSGDRTFVAERMQDDCIADMRALGYAETGRTRSNTMLVRS